ncbi:MAG TPA: histone deacetylase [Flavitalea sp.]|nr:histone deacetylase [Flavitalea sp.]
MYIAYDPVYVHPLPEGHRFPMIKYELIADQLLYEGLITKDEIFSALPCPDDILSWTHSNTYILKLHNQGLNAKEQRVIGFPQSPGLTHRELVITQGTLNCSVYALKHGVALNIAGGTHHAYADHGEGFCLLNDFAVAANFLLRTGKTDKVLIIDLDVHQGNGTAAIFTSEKRVFTFSMHGKHNYPFRKERSDLDIALDDDINDEPYLALLEKNLYQILHNFKPGFAFYLSGVDVLASDKFGKLKMTIEGCKKRDEMVFRFLHQLKIPCAVAMGGGYTEDVRVIVDAHCNTFRAAKMIYG